MAEWTVNNIPDQRGKVVVVTGGNSGIGYEAALAGIREADRGTVCVSGSSAQRAMSGMGNAVARG